MVTDNSFTAMSAMLAPSKKKFWSKPELIVLVRGRTEESVLVTCKNAGASASGGIVAEMCANGGILCSERNPS